MPSFKPSAAAASLNAHMRKAAFTRLRINGGVSSDAGKRRSIRSVESRLSHTERKRREDAFMVIPNDGPLSDGATPVFGEREHEGGAAQPTEAIGTACCGGDMPARFRRAGEQRRTMAQQENEAAPRARRAGQPGRGAALRE